MITPKTIGQFLLGNREAIERIASSKGAFFLAGLFIVAAGLARNYDHHILTQEPLWIFGPIGMTFFSSFFIFAFVKVCGGLRRGALKSIPTPCSNYFPFLRCFAMTAPLAWFYGIPVEQFTNALAATQFNFSVLLLVSFWRLVLMIRVLIVLFNFTPLRAFCLISIPASIEMFFATLFKSIDIVGIMGGMKLTTAENFLYSATRTVTTGSFFLFISACLLIFFSKRGEIRALPPVEASPKISPVTWTAAIAVIALWLLSSTRPQERLRKLEHFQTLVDKRQYEEAQVFCESLTPADFPPHRRLLKRTFAYTIPIAAETLLHHNKWPDWVREDLDESVRIWLEDLEPRNKEDYRISDLREHHHEAPFIEEFAKKFTPGIDLRITPTDAPESLPTTIGDDRSQ